MEPISLNARRFPSTTYELIFGVFWLRIALGAASSLLMALSTCEYSRKNGRMVVVAKRIAAPSAEVGSDA